MTWYVQGLLSRPDGKYWTLQLACQGKTPEQAIHEAAAFEHGVRLLGFEYRITNVSSDRHSLTTLNFNTGGLYNSDGFQRFIEEGLNA